MAFKNRAKAASDCLFIKMTHKELLLSQLSTATCQRTQSKLAQQKFILVAAVKKPRMMGPCQM
jgi:hypothetical protein